MSQEPTPINDLGKVVWEDASLEVVEEQRSTDLPPERTPENRRKSHRRKRLLIWAGSSLLLIALVVAIVYAFLRAPAEQPQTTYVINTQSLDNGTLNELTQQADGAIRQQLTISPDTLFKNSVDIQGSLTVRGKTILQGETTAEQVTVNRSLTVIGNTSLASNLAVNGQISASSLSVGSITISSVNLSGDLIFSGHLVSRGSAPTARASVAAGSGTVTISGNDTSGTIIINTSGSVLAGEMAIIRFRNSFGTTPRVQLTPVNESASKLSYFATKSADFFTVNASSLPVSGQTYIFDYLVTE